MKLNNIIILLGFCLVHLSAHANNFNLQSRHYSVKDGMICNTVNDVTQDKDGYIWLATANGFCRFDGYSFVNFSQLGIGDKTETASNISLLLNDMHNGLIWGYTPQQSIYCYELSKGRFVDYTGIGDFNRPFKNKCNAYSGMWLYSSEFGVRHIIYNNGDFTLKDYTLANGLLQGKSLNVDEDKHHTIWMSSDHGLQRILPDGKRQVLIKNQNIKYRTLGDQYYAAMTDKGEVYLYHLDGKLVKRSHLPSVMPIVGKSRASMFWKGAWYIFSEGDTYAMDLKTGNFFKPEVQIKNAIDKNHLPSYYCFYDKHGKLHLFGKNGWKKELHLMSDPALINARDRNFSVAEDVFGRLFIASYGNGLYVYSPKEDKLQHFSAHDKDPLIGTDFLLNIFIDRYNCIWLTTGYGLYCLTEIDGLNERYAKPTERPTNEWSNFVRHVNYIGNNKLVASTKDNENYLYDINTGTFTPFMHTDATVYSYKKDKQGHTWIATKGAGLMVDGQKYNTNDPVYKIPTNNIYDFAFDQYGRTWIATWEGGLLLAKYQGNKPMKFEQFLQDDSKESQIHDLFIDKRGKLWASTNKGIIMVDTRKKNITKNDFVHYNSTTCGLPVNQIICGLEAKNGKLWFGTSSGVLLCQYPEKNNQLSFELLNTAQGLINNTVRTIAEDRAGNIWVTTEEGLSRINSKTKKMKSFVLGNSFSENAYTENCATALPNGALAFGSENGILFIKPGTDKYVNNTPLKVTITDMSINGVSIYNKELEGIMDKALSYTKEITLPYDKNSLSISFSNFFYPEINSTMYQYYLEGIDEDWRPATSINHADFSDLQPGHYTLHLRTLNTNNEWSEETLLEITIRQPWYNTWWAWMLYLIIIGGIAFFLYREWKKNFDLHQQVKMEKQMADFRIDFFTHISHEFRTPLAIIQSTIEKLTNAGEGYVNRNTLSTLNRGSKRMQRLINQLMEFRKINTGNMKLQVEKGDIVPFVRNIYNDLWNIAKQKDISMSFTPWMSKYEMYFDQQKVETIVYNLLSNAVKYTPDKGIISVRLYQEADKLIFSVEDNGPGIKAEREGDLFKPFMHGYVSKGGMGIGLYTAHQMAELHKGKLSYQRSSDLEGSLFTLTLPCDESVYQPEDIVEKKALDTNSIDKEEIDTIVREMTPQAINNVTVMVIEDDPDMMQQIKSELSVYFHVEGFMNGRTGYENVKKVKPALLISDIMLPEMSGYEIVSSLKADPETQNIPVIMLTAFDDANHILKAYKSYVDDYMVKPCNFKLLIARALQFVAMDMKAKQKKEAEAVNETENASTNVKPVKELKKTEPTLLMSTLDKKFKDKVEAIVAQHLSDNTFNVDRLAELLSLGRTTVYNRTKAIMGVSPNMYIQNERLRIASQMLLEGEYTVSEISEKVGFSDATYFYKCFKNKFGVAPSKYGK